MTEYEIWLSTDTGSRLANVTRSHLGFHYVLSAQQVGALSLVLPVDVDPTLLAEDRLIEIWRAPESGHLTFERQYFLRKLNDATDADGVSRYTVGGLDGNYLLTAPIVAYNAGSAQASKAAAADDLMKAIVRENLGATATDTARQRQAANFTVQADLGLGPTVTKAFSRRTVLGVLQEISDAAREEGTPVYFDVVSVAPGQFEFRTFINQMGRDRTYPGNNDALQFGLEWWNMAQPELEWDWSDEVNYVYAGGKGEGAAREIVTAEDATRSQRSIWARREAFVDASNEDTDGLTSMANARLSDGRPRLRFTAKIVDRDGCRYGKDWQWGDKVSATHRGQVYDSPIPVVDVSVGGNGFEAIGARLELNG